MRGLVIARAGAKTEIWLPEEQRVVLGIPRGKLIKQGERIYAGDWVQVRTVSPHEVAIDAVEDRKNLLPQPPVANVDKLLIVVSWREPDFSNLVLDGLLAQAEFFELPVTIVFNKMDLVRKREATKLEKWVRLYESIGYPVLKASVETGEGLDQLWETMKGNLVVLAGPSGVGKSSILNALIPGAQLRTDEVSEKTGRGRHVTTEVRLLPNPHGGWVADTPAFKKLTCLSGSLWKLCRCFTASSTSSPASSTTARIQMNQAAALGQQLNEGKSPQSAIKPTSTGGTQQGRWRKSSFECQFVPAS